MGYPGDQGKPGDRPPGRPPHEPYGPGAEAPPYGTDNDDPFPPRGEAAFGYRDESSFAPRDEGPGGQQQYGGEPFAGPPGQSSSWSDDTPSWSEQPSASPWSEQQAGSAWSDQKTDSGWSDQKTDSGWSDQKTDSGWSGQEGDSGWSNQQPGSGWSDQPVAGGAHAQGDDPFGSPGPYGGFEPTPPGPAPESSGPGSGGTGRRNMPLIIGGAAVAGLLLIGGGVALSSVLKDDPEPKKPTPSTAAAQPQATPSPTQPVLAPVKLQSRTTDPKPLTLKEVFGNGKFKVGKYQYVRTAANAEKGCTAIAGGTALDKALKGGSCTQVLRATYALSNGSLIGTVGVFNLETEAAAKKAVKAAAAKDAFLLALPGKGVSKTNGKGEALGTSEARGHYLIMTWVQRPDGKRIAAKYHAAVRVFGAQMVKGSNLALALHYRETEGKPLQK
ncbi:hypothetical protein ACFOY4_43615 [Actinomadura syzygii]|uniref:Uncharacterized protein n=1 Tax=Actinomadura syzygii TaxID=1427538 RepID=A0A5D0UJR7_9ACTN|nr:hypothetical protein [Actinomadura syzygii]TYC18207.1 hypothetical protein FXF65_00030 [Actinomadura syzygii]